MSIGLGMLSYWQYLYMRNIPILPMAILTFAEAKVAAPPLWTASRVGKYLKSFIIDTEEVVTWFKLVLYIIYNSQLELVVCG